MGILPIFYSVGVIIFAIFWYGIASLGSGYCTNSMAEANLLVIALFLLMFPVLFEFLEAYILARRHEDEDERSWRKARRLGSAYGVLAAIVIGFMIYKISQSNRGNR
jgi:predicted permease